MATEPASLAEVRARPDMWRKAGIGLGAALMIALAGAMAWLASSAPPADAVLLGFGAFVMAGFALSGQWWRPRRAIVPPIASLRSFDSPWLVYPLGALLLVRFLILPAELWTSIVGVTAGLVFLLPVVLFVAYAFLAGGF